MIVIATAACRLLVRGLTAIADASLCDECAALAVSRRLAEDGERGLGETAQHIRQLAGRVAAGIEAAVGAGVDEARGIR